MARFQVHKVTALPSPLEAHAIYLVTSGTDYVEMYVTGASASTVRRHINEADVQSLIDAAVGGLGAMDIVDDIAARDALDLSCFGIHIETLTRATGQLNESKFWSVL